MLDYRPSLVLLFLAVALLAAVLLTACSPALRNGGGLMSNRQSGTSGSFSYTDETGRTTRVHVADKAIH